MNLQHISGSNGLRPLKPSLHEISHITIETNQTCNLKCRTCYNLYQDTIKNPDQIKEEIDLALTNSIPIDEEARQVYEAVYLHLEEL